MNQPLNLSAGQFIQPHKVQPTVQPAPAAFSLAGFKEALITKATAEKKQAVTVPDFLMAMLDQPEVASLIQSKGGDIAALKRGLEEEVRQDAEDPRTVWAARVSHVQRVPASMDANRAGESAGAVSPELVAEPITQKARLSGALEEIFGKLQVEQAMMQQPISALRLFQDYMEAAAPDGPFRYGLGGGAELQTFQIAKLDFGTLFPEPAAAKQQEEIAQKLKKLSGPEMQVFQKLINETMARVMEQQAATIKDAVKTGIAEGVPMAMQSMAAANTKGAVGDGKFTGNTSVLGAPRAIG